MSVLRFDLFENKHARIKAPAVLPRLRIAVQIVQRQLCVHQEIAPRRKGEHVFVIHLLPRGYFIYRGRVEPLETDARHRSADDILGGADDRDRRIFILGNGHKSRHVPAERIAQTVMVSELQKFAVLFVKRDLRRDRFHLVFGQLAHIQLIAEQTAAGDVEPRFQRIAVARLMVGAGGNVRAHHRLRIAVRGARLDLQALARVGIVARPVLLKITEVAEIEPSAAARAPLEQNGREFFGDAGHRVRSQLRILPDALLSEAGR